MIEFLKDALKYIIVLVVVIIINIFIITLDIVSGNSMRPKYNNNDLLLIENVSVMFNRIERIDIVLINTETERRVIKRVIGMPSETIYYRDNVLYINNERVAEDFLRENTITEDFGPITLGDNEYFVLGDNRYDSLDSRDYGPITKRDITGKSIIRLWPIRERS